MKNKLTTPMLASIGAFVLMLALFFSFYFSTSAYRSESSGIVLPPTGGSEPVVPDVGGTRATAPLAPITVTPENVQDVVRSLTRPESYSMTVRNTVVYGEQQHTLLRRQLVKNGACRTDERSAGGSVQRSTLRYADKLYAWESGAASYATIPVGDFSSEGEAMLPSYESVLALAPEAIEAAQLQNLNYVPCIYVRAQENGFITDYYISTVTGLLVRAEVREGERLLRTCEMSEVSTEPPADSYFVLPGGTSVLDKKES